MTDSARPLILVVRHAYAEPEVVYDYTKADLWFADSYFNPSYYNDLDAQLEDINDLIAEADKRSEPAIANQLRALAAQLAKPTVETVYRTREAAEQAQEKEVPGA